MATLPNMRSLWPRVGMICLLLLLIETHVADGQECWRECMKDQDTFINEIKDYVKESFDEVKLSMDALKRLVEQHMPESGNSGCPEAKIPSSIDNKGTTSKISKQPDNKYQKPYKTKKPSSFFVRYNNLMIGPGTTNGGSSEVLSLPDFTSTNCTVPVIKGGAYGYVAIPSKDGPMLCGGKGFGKDFQSDCHVLTEEGIWVTLPPFLGMKKMRFAAAAVQFDKGWLVTGGNDDVEYHDTVEFWDEHSWHDYTPLPDRLRGHCLVKLNKTHLLLAGGKNEEESAASYLFSKETGWVRQADMINARSHFSCALMKDDGLVVVAGGSFLSNFEKKTEFFNLGNLTWSPGPDLPTSISGSKMVSLDGSQVFLLGEDKILQLKPVELSTVNWWRWIEVREMKDRGTSWDLVPLEQKHCK